MTLTNPKAWLSITLAAVAGVAGATLWLKRAGAGGIPTAPTLHYSGTLVENGQPVTGNRTVAVSLWTAESAGQKVCDDAESVAVTAGRFRIALGDECVNAVRATPNLWAEVNVGGTSFARKKLGAVTLAPGTWRLKLRGMAEALGTSATTNMVTTDWQFGTSTTPGQGLVADKAIAHHYSPAAGNFTYVPIEYETRDLTVAATTTYYVHTRYRSFSGSPSLTAIKLRDETVTEQGLDPTIIATRVK